MNKKETYKVIEDYYRGNYKRLVNTVRGRAGSHHNAKDVVQEAFTRALKYHRSSNSDLPFDVWFSRILENSLRTHTKERKSQGMVYELKPNMLIVHTPDSFLQRFISELREDIEKLSEKKKEVMNLSMFMDYSPNDISKIMNISVGAIRTMMHRFREELKEKYGKGVYS